MEIVVNSMKNEVISSGMKAFQRRISREALEQSSRDLCQQRDELVRQLAEERRRGSEQREEMETLSEQQKTLQQRFGVLALVHSLQQSAVMPAFSLVRRVMREERKQESVVETTTGGVKRVSRMLGRVVFLRGGGSDEEDLEDYEEEESYGTDLSGQEEWAELMKANSVEACFMGAESVAQNATRAGQDLQEHVSNITTSLEFFPQTPAASGFFKASHRGFTRIYCRN